MLKAKQIVKSYGDLTVLKGVDFHVDEGEIVSIVGPSGAGKSTLLQILGSLTNATTGDVFYENLNLNTLSGAKLAKFRNENIGFIFQFHHLLPEFTALENVCMPAFINGLSKNAATKRGEELLSILGLGKRMDHKPSELSGGEQQRVAVARALMNKPRIIFADEPSGNLDSENAEDLHELFKQLRKDFGYSFVIVTHNKDLAKMADRTVEMRDGQIEN